MASHRPLIVSAGELQQMPAEDSIFERLTFTFDGGSLLGAGQVLTFMDNVAKSFQVIKLESVLLYPVRLRLYASAATQAADAFRDPSTPPTPQSEHGVILDVYLTDTTGYVWTMSPNASGSTADGTATVYFTMGNGSALALHPQVIATILRFE